MNVTLPHGVNGFLNFCSGPMMRSKPSSSMQKTYDECYLMCSTAVYFEGQNNEPEALRSWKSALETIYYHNAHRVPSTYTPKNETERALQDSLRELELQSKERVDLLEALRESRKEAAMEAAECGTSPLLKGRLDKTRSRSNGLRSASGSGGSPGCIGDGTIPSLSFLDLSRPPTLPPRPAMQSRSSLESMAQSPTGKDNLSGVRGGGGGGGLGLASLPSPPTLPVPSTKASSRPSSPEKKKTMLTTLRGKDYKASSGTGASSPRKVSRPAASKAAGLAWNAISGTSGTSVPQTNLGNDSGGTTPRKSTSSSDSSFRRDVITRNNSNEETPTPSRVSHRTDGPTGMPTARRVSNDYAAPKLAVNAATAAAHRPIEGDFGSSFPDTSSSLSRSLETKDPYSKPKKPVVKPKPDAEYYPRKEPYDFPHVSKQSVTPSRSSTGSKPNPDKTVSDGRVRRPRIDGKNVTTSKPRGTESTPNVGLGSKGSDEDDSHRVAGNRQNKPASQRPGKGAPRKTSKSSHPPNDSPTSEEGDEGEGLPDEFTEHDKNIQSVMKNLPKGIDDQSAKQILNEIIVRGDEVRWDDVAGLEGAKNALKEAVVYPFLRPDLFMGLREPARGMLLFGPPGTGKTMLARAVATESRSTFFSVSASTLTSKWHGESEKLVRALFELAKALAPSIIFVDEIDSLLSSRSKAGEVEASRRSKTEFLIQWSDLQRAAAGREQSEKEKKQGDPTRVLVLAATNMPWDIDEAARRRFVRRQYIPLPEDEVRKMQFQKLLSHQKHELSDEDLEVLVKVTDGFSGSDITALAKDAAMGPLRNLGEDLLHTPMDEISPIQFKDFEASMFSIRPSVSREGLKHYEEWAKEFGERGG